MTPLPEPENEKELSEKLTPEEQRRFDLLNQYFELLHTGDYQSRSLLLEDRPEFRELLSCLESLDSLAIPLERLTCLLDDHGTQTDLESSSTPPRTFGKYELLEEIGRGGMGVVHRALQTDLNRTVAIKLILSSQFASAEEVRRFYIEARSAGQLRHPNVVGIHEVGEVNDQHYFAMDFIEGDSLSVLLRQTEFSPELAAELIAEIANAVDYLHHNGIVHRDLKPGNIIIDDDGKPYVTDFGLAKFIHSEDQQTQSGTILGTPSYMAPEQAAAQNHLIGPAADIYSLGAIFYEMLTGVPPFKEENPLDTLVQVLEGEPSRPSYLNRSIPRDLELICMKCLEKNIDRRYQSAAELADDIGRYLRREAVEARPTNIFHKLRRWSRREPALVSRLAALLTAAGIVQVSFMVHPERDLTFHMKIMSLFCIWGILAVVYQRMLRHSSLMKSTHFLWSATDVILLTIVLIITGEPTGTLHIGYPLLIVAAGMFFRVRLVWFTTLVSILSFGVLLWFRPESNIPVHHHIIFVAVLAILGFMVGYQIYRVRALSRYYRSRE